MERNFLRPSYEQVIRDNIISNDVSYLSWLEDNNFGVPVNLDPNKYELVMESRGVADNKRKFVNTIQKGDWFNNYQKAWSRIYRVKTSKAVRNDIANWADWRYWSSTHGLKKNRHVEYSLNTFLKGSFDYAYCSKLVWQALYYGSGNLPLVNPRPSAFLMAPYFLPGEISTRYNYNMYGPY